MNGWSTFVRQTTALCLLLAVALAVVMLTVAHQVQRLEEEMGSLRREIVSEQEKIDVLHAEFSFLAEPERLRRLAARHLGLVPIEPSQLASFATIEQALKDQTTDAPAGTAKAGVRVASNRDRTSNRDRVR